MRILVTGIKAYYGVRMLSSLRCALALLAGSVLTIAASAQSLTLTRSATTFTGVGFYAPTVAFGNGTFVALGLKPTPPAAASNSVSAYTSPDGDTWTERVVALGGGGFAGHGAIRFINGRFVFTGTTLDGQQRTYTATSADGVTWSVATTPNSEKFADIVTGGGTSIGLFATTLSSSADGGTTWTSRSAPGVTSTSPYQALAYGNGRFVLVSTNRAWTSPDGATWTDIAGTQSSGRVAFGNGLFALTGTAYRTSTDGVTFTARTPTGMTLTGTNNLRFAAGRFLYHQFTFSGITPVNQIIASADGITWTPFAAYPAGSAMNMNDVAEGNNRLVVVGFNQSQVPIAAFLDTTNLPTAPTAPVISAQPVAANAVAGGSATFSVTASGTGNTYQWRKDGQPIAGATAATLTVSNITAASAGAYNVVITNSIGTTTSAAATLALVTASNSGRLVNLSVRTAAGTGDNTLIVGLGLGGAGTSGSKAVLIRGVGPTLSAFGVSGLLPDPVMTLFQGQTQSAQNDDWAGGFDFSSVGAFAYSGTPVRDAAIYNPAIASGSYSIQITGKNNATGIALAEIYDATSATAFAATTPRLVNVSARTQVGTGDNILIAGFSIGGSTAVRVLIRAVGPTLGAAPFNVSGTLADPKLEIYSGSTKTIENDNWAGTAELKAAFSAVAAFALSADNSRDAALVATLQPGSYTAQISGIGNTSGVALVEIYELP